MTENTLTSLSHLGLIHVSGHDSETFLQGQLTCDMKLLTEKLSSPAAYCTPKGRAIASFQVIKRGNNDYFLTLSIELVEKVIKRLKIFVMRSDVSIRDVTASCSILGLTINDQKIIKLPSDLDVPTEAENSSCNESSAAIRIAENPTRFIILSTDNKEEQNSLTCDSNSWILQDIKSGLPLITQATSEEHIPQMFNLDLLGGISFKKGCYSGQEIIARMHYLGKLKQRTFLVSTQSKTLPEPNAAIFDDEKKVGSVLLSARDKDNSVKMLVVMQISHEKTALKLKNNMGSAINFRDLPYTFDRK
jgi:folate-binding protein YgfZ